MIPLTLLFCCGLDDIGTATRKASVFWLGVILLLILLSYFQGHTSSGVVTKTAMPLLATGGGVMPHVARRLHFLFIIISLAAGAAGLLAFYLVLTTYLSGSSLANEGIGFVLFGFAVASVSAAVLTVSTLSPRFAKS